jgi:hypothetical protein
MGQFNSHTAEISGTGRIKSAMNAAEELRRFGSPEQRAYHEAGHSVAYVLCGKEVHSASIKLNTRRADKPTGGRIRVFGRPRSKEELPYTATSQMAGGAAAARFGQGKFASQGIENDWLELAEDCARFQYDKDGCNEIRKRAQQCASELFELPELWAATCEIAQLLAKRKYLRGPLIHRIVDRSCGTQTLRQISPLLQSIVKKDRP